MGNFRKRATPKDVMAKLRAAIINDIKTPYVHHVTVEIPIISVAACKEFYAEVLGLTIAESLIGDTIWFEEGVHLFYGSGEGESEIVAAKHFALVVGDKYVDIVRAARKLGLFIHEGRRYWDSPRCFIKDPANNRIEIIKFAPKP